jgi:cell division protein FtsB
MNWLKYLVGLSAIIVAGCAAYFSVTGLGVLFAGASTSVMIMASSLELAKLVAATYLKQTWDDIKGFNKWYLTISVAILMMITSAGIFGYLSNAFQQQNLQLQQVDREILVHTTKIEQTNSQINQLSTQITEFNSNQGKIIDGGKVNSRLLRSIDNRDKQIAKLNDKIAKLQEDNAKENEAINQIKTNNLGLEKEVGGFRFVAEAFGLELNTVVKFFIFIIVIVFDPLAVALIIAFNGLIGKKNMYGESEPLVEKNYQIYEDSGKDFTLETETPIVVENNLQFDEADSNKDGIVSEEELREWYEKDGWKDPYQGMPYYQHPWFDWNKKERWINDRNAINYWITYGGGNHNALKEMQKSLNLQ